MHTFLLTLHVVAVVFVIGPLVALPNVGLRGIRTGKVDLVRDAARLTTIYGLASLVVFALGAAVVPTKPDDYTFGSIWVTASMTLYLVALLITLLVLAPALNKATTLLGAGTLVDDHSRDRQATPDLTVTATAQDLQTKATMDAVRGRIAASGGTVALIFLAITVLMVWQPFGR